jgi:hypothetical protein
MGAGWGALSRAHAGTQGLDFGRKLLGVPMADLPQVIDMDLLHRGRPTQLSQFFECQPKISGSSCLSVPAADLAGDSKALRAQLDGIAGDAPLGN